MVGIFFCGIVPCTVALLPFLYFFAHPSPCTSESRAIKRSQKNAGLLQLPPFSKFLESENTVRKNAGLLQPFIRQTTALYFRSKMSKSNPTKTERLQSACLSVLSTEGNGRRKQTQLRQRKQGLFFGGLFGVYLGFNSANKPQNRLNPTKSQSLKNRIK